MPEKSMTARLSGYTETPPADAESARECPSEK
jgi:hypothetical protein